MCVKKEPFLLGHMRNVTTNDDSSVLRKKNTAYTGSYGAGIQRLLSAFFNGTSSKCTIL